MSQSNQKPVGETLTELIGEAGKTLAESRSAGHSEASDICFNAEVKLRDLLAKWQAIPQGLQGQYEERYQQEIHSQRNQINTAKGYLGHGEETEEAG